MEITAEAVLIVRAPLRLSDAAIERAVLSKKSWVEKKIAEAKNRPRAKKKEFVDGEEFLYLGEVYCLKIFSGRDIDLAGKLFFPKKFLKRPVDYLTKWYKKQAQEIIDERAKIYAEQMGLKFSSIKISGAKKRWGSCNHLNHLNFSWRLIMAPLEVVDYVVVHELAHVKHKNHSAAFWNLVKEHYPEAVACRKWLKTNGQVFNL